MSESDKEKLPFKKTSEVGKGVSEDFPEGSVNELLKEIMRSTHQIDELKTRVELHYEELKHDVDSANCRALHSIRITVKVIKQGAWTTFILLLLIAMSFFDEQIVSFAKSISAAISVEIVSIAFGGLGLIVGVWQLIIARRALKQAGSKS